MVAKAASVPNSIDKISDISGSGSVSADGSNNGARINGTGNDRIINGSVRNNSKRQSNKQNKKSMVRSRSLTNNNNNNNNQNNKNNNNIRDGSSSSISNKKNQNNSSYGKPNSNSKCAERKIKSQDRNAPVMKRSRGNEIGSTDTLEIIASKSTGSEPSTPDDNINVVVRVRPLNEKEKKSNEQMVLQFPGNGQVLCDGRSPGSSSAQSIKLFTYNVVFEPGATQEDILEYSGIKRIIEMAIEGFSCTAFCYGQTGSGKTHTLTGPPELFLEKPDPSDERHGLIFRSFLYLFQLLRDREDTNFILKASFLEIYNEKVIDLLNPGSARKPLAVRWSKKLRGFFVENLFTVDCEELDDLLAVLEEGMRNRVVGSHQMNDHSSRSHTILTVHINSEQQADNGVFISKQGKVNFVDLAGSEMTKKTLSEGKTLEEANNINKSLMVLGYCISSLSDLKKRSGHIPYRDSQLTKLLADSLAGNGVTLMIACVSPSQSNHSETLNTLRYASRAKKIRTKPVVVMDPREALILSLKRDINVLQIENEHLKAALNFHNETLALSQNNNNTSNNNNNSINNYERIQIPEAPKIDIERLTELENSELAELVKLYMVENKSLRDENSQLYLSRDMVLRDQELVCRENERLLKKLEDVNSVCVRSPLIPARSALSSSSQFNDTSSEIWTNPDAVEQITTTDTTTKPNSTNNQNMELDANQNESIITKNEINTNPKFSKKNSIENESENDDNNNNNRKKENKNHNKNSINFLPEKLRKKLQNIQNKKLLSKAIHTNTTTNKNQNTKKDVKVIPNNQKSSEKNNKSIKKNLSQSTSSLNREKDFFGSVISLDNLSTDTLI